MLFNSLHFAFFLILSYSIYRLFDNNSLVVQNTLVLFASYFFHASWDWGFLFLLIVPISLDYVTGIKIENAMSKRSKSVWFWISIVINLGFLGVFKYYNFFTDSFCDLLAEIGVKVHPSTINIVLPVGISFYTFHGLSYVIDIYKHKIKAEKNIIDYCLFVSFFPLLIAGSFVRATHLLPQLKKKGVNLFLGYSLEYIKVQKFIINWKQIIELYQRISISQKISFLDYSNDSILYQKKYFYNSEHLNELGANFFSRKFSEDLKKIYNVR